MSKHWSFPRQTRCDVSDPTGLFEVRGEMYSEPGVQDTKAYLQSISHLCLVLSLPSIALLWIHAACAHASVCWINKSLLVGFTNLFFSFFLSVFSLFLSVAGLDRPLSSHMTTRTPGSSTTPTGNSTICIRQQLRAASTHSVANSNLPSCSTFKVPHPHRHRHPRPLQAPKIIAPPESSPRRQKHFWLMWFGIMNWEKMLKRCTLPASGRLSLPPTVFTPPLTHRGSFAPILCWRSSGETFGQRSNLKSRSFINENTVQVWLFTCRKLRHVYVIDGLVRNTVSLF